MITVNKGLTRPLLTILIVGVSVTIHPSTSTTDLIAQKSTSRHSFSIPQLSPSLPPHTAMSASLEANNRQTASTKKQFGKGEREIAHHSQKAKKWYPAEDEVKPKQVC